MIHGSKLYVDSIDYKRKLTSKLIDRDNYLDIKDLNLIGRKVSAKQPLLFLCNDVNESPPFFDYKLYIHGILPCGSKTTVEITGIYPYVDIDYDYKLNDEGNLEKLKEMFNDNTIKKILKNKSLDIRRLQIIEGKHLIGFEENKSKFIRIYFNRLHHRNTFIKYITKRDIKSYNNDISCYYRVVSRTFKIYLSSWNSLENYRLLTRSDFKSKYVISIDISDFKPYDVDSHETNDLYKDIDFNLILKDKMISMAFDIEQYSSDFNIHKPDRKTRLPSGKIKDDVVFNIGMTYQFINEKDSFLNIGLVTKEVNAHEDYYSIICKDEKTLLLCFTFINSILQPDFIYEFNGSQFDNPNLYDKFILNNILEESVENLSIKKLSMYDLKKENIAKYIYKEEYVKISADSPNQKMANFNLQGYIPFDLRIIFKQLNPTESKSSLKFYLELYGLPSKDDMPIPLLFKHYITGNVEGLTEVVHYCYIDCFRLHELLTKVNVIQDKREVAKLSYTSLFDAFYRAGGVKVRNLIIANAVDQNLFYNNIKNDFDDEDQMSGKYIGGFVAPPIKGLVNNTMTLKEFMKSKLDIYDNETLNKVQEILNNNYEAVFINKNINRVKF